MHQVHVAIVASRFKRSGPINVVASIVRAAIDRARFTLIGLSPEGDESLLPELQDLGVGYESLRLSRWGWVAGRGALVDVLERYDADLVHSHGFRADTLVAVSRPSIPTVSTIHTYPPEDYRFSYGTTVGRGFAEVHLQVLRRLPKVVSVSQSLAEKLAARNVKSVVVRNGVDTSVYRPPVGGERNAIRRRLEIAEDSFVCVSVGHLSPLKNPVLVVRGFVEANIPNSHLFVLGNGEEMSKCQEVASTERVHLLGRTAAIAEILKAADVFISGSNVEGMPMAVLEALSTNLRCALTDIPPHRELRDMAPDKVQLYAARDASALGVVLRRLASSHYDSGRCANTFAFSQERMAKEYIEIYQSLVQ